jgi:hypothetical protein
MAMPRQEKGDLLIKVTAQAGLTICFSRMISTHYSLGMCYFSSLVMDLARFTSIFVRGYNFPICS